MGARSAPASSTAASPRVTSTTPSPTRPPCRLKIKGVCRSPSVSSDSLVTRQAVALLLPHGLLAHQALSHALPAALLPRAGGGARARPPLRAGHPGFEPCVVLRLA